MTTNFVRAAGLALGLCAAGCVNEMRHLSHADGMPDPTHAGPVQHELKRHRVWVRGFTTAWGGDVALPERGTSLAQEAARIVAERFAASARIALDDPPTERPGEWQVLGKLEGSTRGVRSVEMRLLSRDGTEVALVRQECTAVDEHGLDRRALERAADAIERTVADLPWTSSVSEVSQRLLVITAGQESALTVNELLIVRLGGKWRRDSSGHVLQEPGDEVARVYVDALLERDGKPNGAYCRLWGGSFSGFDPIELTVEEP